MKINIKHLLFSPIVHSIVFFLLYKWLKGQSGGDMVLSLFSIIFLVVLTLGIGMYSFSWDIKEKIGLIIGLVLSYLMEYILLSITLP